MDVQILLKWMAGRGCQLTVEAKEDCVLLQLDTKRVGSARCIRHEKTVSYLPRNNEKAWEGIPAGSTEITFPLALINGLEIMMEQTQAELYREQTQAELERSDDGQGCETRGKEEDRKEEGGSS